MEKQIIEVDDYQHGLIINSLNDKRKLPAADGKTLVLVTCYPFRYSGHAPGKCIVAAIG
ncbi:MAG: hypothetical protein FWF10_01700 [Clostridiales bacterium]|nr:hypothetical protein [Clostridiales bacterium]